MAHYFFKRMVFFFHIIWENYGIFFSIFSKDFAATAQTWHYFFSFCAQRGNPECLTLDRSAIVAEHERRLQVVSQGVELKLIIHALQ